MRRIYGTNYWPGRESEDVEDVFFHETPRLPDGLCDQFFTSDAPRVRWLIAYRAARLAMRDRFWNDMSKQAAGRITDAVRHFIGYREDRQGECGRPTAAQFDACARAAFIAIGEYHWVYGPLADKAFEPLVKRPPLPPLGTALRKPQREPQVLAEPMRRAA